MLNRRMTDDPAEQRAQEARAGADKLNDSDAKKTMLEIAAAFERLAIRAEMRGKPAPDAS